MSRVPSAPPDPIARWKQRGIHTLNLPSGERVRARIPNLEKLIELDAIPETLRAVAMLEYLSAEGAGQALSEQIMHAAATGDAEKVESLRPLAGQLGSLKRVLVADGVLALVNPDGGDDEPVQLQPDDLLDGFPEEDVDMLADIFMRQRVVDAKGVRVGVAPMDWAARFREDEHECAAGCAACAQLQRDASSVGVV